jgi:hypothetical protein
MDRGEFGVLIENICHYWERKVPERVEVLNAWYRKVEFIPGGFGERIFESFTRMNTRPVNIPKTIREIFNGMTVDPDKKRDDFLISMVMKNAQNNGFGEDYLGAFYDLRYAIRRKSEINLGPCIRWLKSCGFTVDIRKLDEPSIINFQEIDDWQGRIGDAPTWMQKEIDFMDSDFNGQF